MLIKFFKFILIFLFFLSPLYSKSKTFNDFNSHHLSNYFSGIVAYNNNDNFKALNFFRSSKFLIKEHNFYLKNYIYSLILEGKVQEATREIKKNTTKDNSIFFEAHLILTLDSLKKENYKESKEHLRKTNLFVDNDRISSIIVETLEEYLYIFEEKKVPNTKKDFGNFSFINEIFQRCYLNDKKTDNYFESLINNDDNTDYSRYLFFYINYLIENNRYTEAKALTDNLNYLNSTLIISQAKLWIESQNIKEFGKIFSCKNPKDLIGELFFLIANIYSSQNNYKQSNFYLNISYDLNPKFLFNLSLLADNYYLNQDYSKTLETLNFFNKKDIFYYWFKLKKKAQVISKQQNGKASLNFIISKFKAIKDPPIKLVFDVANLYKKEKEYKQAIEYYNQVMLKIDIASPFYSEILYRRGGSYERMGDYKNSDKDLLKSLEINPDDAYILNYLAYSWLERNYKIDTALKMLERAYEFKSNDPYIIDSIGWAYYLIKDYLKAEKFLKRAVELMPEDPIVNDHYGDILWKLDRKIQARYFWKSVLYLEETEEKMKKIIEDKLTNGLENT